MNIKLFEQFNEEKYMFESNIKKDKVEIYLYRAPKDSESMAVIDGKIRWELPLEFSKNGIEMSQEAFITSLDLLVETEDENRGVVKEEIKIPEGTFKLKQFETVIRNFPLYMDEININMNYSKNPKDWQIEMIIGS